MPNPARTAVLPSPLGSQEIPMRGANMFFFVSCRYLFGPGIPGATQTPLQPLLPSAGLYSEGMKLLTALLGLNGGFRIEYRNPTSTVRLRRIFQLSAT